MGILATKPTEDENEATVNAGKDPNKKGDDPKAGKAGGDKPYSFEKKELPESQIELEITVKPEAFNVSKDRAYEKLAKEVKIPGFRPGKAPRNLVEAKLGARLYEEAINDIIPTITAAVLVEANVNPLDYAKYNVKKFSNQDGLLYSATFTVMPEIKLPDFKKLGVKKDEVKVESKEIDDVFKKLESDIENRKEGPVKSEKVVEGKDEKAGEISEAKDKKSDEKSDENSAENSGKKSAEKAEKKESKDEKKAGAEKTEVDWGKELGDSTIKTEADVKKRIEDSLKSRKQKEADEKYINELLEKAIELAKITPPKNIVEKEANILEDQYKQRIEQLGLSVEDFLKAQNTEIEKLRENWMADAEFKISTELLFAAIGKENSIKVEDKDIQAEIDKIADQKVKESYDNMNGRSMIRGVLYRQKALDILKAQVEGKSK